MQLYLFSFTPHYARDLFIVCQSFSLLYSNGSQLGINPRCHRDVLWRYFYCYNSGQGRIGNTTGMVWVEAVTRGQGC